MNARTLGAVLATAAMIGVTGCSVTRGQQTAGEYVDDARVTTEVKAKFASDPAVAATSIGVETLNGTVQLSGFAKSQSEKDRAVALARQVKGVQAIKNDIVVRP